MTQINTIADSFVSTIHSVCKNSSAEVSDALIKTIIGVVCTIIVSTVVLGGLKRVGAVTEKLVPIMSLVYIGGTLTVIFSNVGNIGPAFSSILEGAFHPSAVVGGVAGITIQQAMKNGVGRGVFSNEAGLGSSPIAHATADTKSPVEQGLYGIFEVFADTLVICTLTALAILCSGVDIAYGTKMGAELSIRAFPLPLAAALQISSSQNRPYAVRPFNGIELVSIQQQVYAVYIWQSGRIYLQDHLLFAAHSRCNDVSGSRMGNSRHPKRPHGSAQPHRPVRLVRNRRKADKGVFQKREGPIKQPPQRL